MEPDESSSPPATASLTRLRLPTRGVLRHHRQAWSGTALGPGALLMLGSADGPPRADDYLHAATAPPAFAPALAGPCQHTTPPPQRLRAYRRTFRSPHDRSARVARRPCRELPAPPSLRRRPPQAVRFQWTPAGEKGSAQERRKRARGPEAKAWRGRDRDHRTGRTQYVVAMGRVDAAGL